MAVRFHASLYAAGLAAVAAAAQLGGCGGAPGPTGPLSKPPTSAPVASSTAPAPPTTSSAPTTDPVLARIPAAARANTQAGAEAFGRFFIEQVAKSWTDADPNLLDGLVATSCRSCAAYVSGAEKLKSEGLHHERPALRVRSAAAYSFVQGHVVIAVEGVQDSVGVVRKDGSRARVTKADEGTFVLTLDWRSHWVVARSQVEAQP